MHLRSRTALGALLAALFIFVSVSPAMALIGPKVTLDQESGGVPTRFTFVTVTDKDAAISGMTFSFPKGFDLSKVTFDAVTLEGLVRTPVTIKGTATGEVLKVTLAPSVAASSTLRIQVYEVVSTNEGGTYPLGIGYSAETTVAGVPTTVPRTDTSVSFEYRTPSFSEIVSRALDGNPYIVSWNSVKALGMFFKPQLIITSIPLLFTGWILAITLILFAFPIAIAGGLSLAFMKMSKVAPLRWVAAGYVNVIRGTPLFLQIFVAFIGLRIAGLRVDDNVTAVAVLAVNSSAYLAEIFRAGIQSINKGQFEAASSLGMNYWQSMQHVIIPQTVKRVLPTMTSEFILLFKDTALLAAIGRPELMFGAQNIVANTGNMTPFVVSAVYYLIITLPLINFVSRLEVRLAVSEHGQDAPESKGRRGWFGRGFSIGRRATAPDEIPASSSRR